MSKKERLGRLLGFPLDPADKRAVERELANFQFTVGKHAAIIIIVMEFLMMLAMCLRPGGPFASPRRQGYFLLYAALILVTAAFLAGGCFLRIRRGDRPELFLGFSAVYTLLISFWGCAITLLDQLGGNNLSVYCYVILSVAAFGVLRPWQAIGIFGSSFFLLNYYLPKFQGDGSNLFSNLVNTFIIVALATLISGLLYRSRVTGFHDKMVIEEQYQKIQEINCRLNRQVMTDELTNMNNRRYLEEVIAERFNDCGLKRLPVAGMMLDIDFFKEYNDHYGHQAGDHCLKEIGAVLLAFVEKERAAAVRYGGEEFFLCLFDCGLAKALEEAEKLRGQIEERRLERQDVPAGRLTVSIGVCANCLSLSDMVDHADKALYQAKAQGRNRVAAYRHSQDAGGN